MSTQVCGSLPAIINNDDGLYEGDLTHYFRVVFNAPNAGGSGGHNFRHMTHVAYMVYQACTFYRQVLTAREMRDLLIAALLHDLGHCCSVGDDDHNISRAIWRLRCCILPEDIGRFDQIASLIRVTRYPYKIPSSELSLSGKIIRDADMSQTFSTAWIQQIIFGFAKEWSKTPLEVLQMQGPFLSKLKFETPWAQALFPQEAIDAKIEEARRLLELLEPAPMQGRIAA